MDHNKAIVNNAIWTDILYKAIDTAKPERLRIVLREICEEVPGAFDPVLLKVVFHDRKDKKTMDAKGYANAQTEGHYHINHSASRDCAGTEIVNAGGESQHEANAIDHRDAVEEPQVAPTVKRPAHQNIETCTQCNQYYNSLHNASETCPWHPGIPLHANTCFLTDLLARRACARRDSISLG
jgi:hypothetical protein